MEHKTDQELKQIAVDMIDGKIVVFAVNPKYPLLEDFTMCYEYLTEQTSRGFFFSCRYLRADEERRLQPFLEQYRKLKNEFLNEPG